MRCQEIEKWLSDNIDGELSEGQKKTLKIHLEKCSSCQGFARDLGKINEETKSLMNFKLSSNYWPAFLTRLQRDISSLQSRERMTASVIMKWRWTLGSIAIIAAIVIGLLLHFNQANFSQEFYVFSLDESLSRIYQEIGDDQELEEVFNSVVFVSIAETFEGSERDIAFVFYEDFDLDNLTEEETKWLISEIEKETEL